MPSNERAPSDGNSLDKAMGLAENVIYVAIAALLLACAFLALGALTYQLVTTLEDGTLTVVEATLDGLLLVFIFVELLGAVRATVTERQLLAEPFLVVGIIAAIKEILVASLKAGSKTGEALEDAMLEIVGLGLVVLLLALAGFLVRRKEREPAEQDG